MSTTKAKSRGKRTQMEVLAFTQKTISTTAGRLGETVAVTAAAAAEAFAAMPVAAQARHVGAVRERMAVETVGAGDEAAH